jgi:hypothetical protein
MGDQLWQPQLVAAILGPPDQYGSGPIIALQIAFAMKGNREWDEIAKFENISKIPSDDVSAARCSGVFHVHASLRTTNNAGSLRDCDRYFRHVER